jgi:lysophospholipase L1-like esterase
VTGRSRLAREWLFRALPSLALVALLAAIEGAVRLLLPPLPALDVLVAPFQARQLVGRQDTEKKRNRPRLFEADPLIFWKLRPNIDRLVWDQTLVSTNERGLRHPRPIGPKRPGSRRIVCLGDSVTYGTRVPEAATADAPGPGAPYPRVLEDLLRATGLDVEVIAMAVPGHSSHQGLAWARRDLAALEPDLVIVCYGWNDVSLMPAPDEQAMRTDALRVAARSVLMNSQAALRVVSALRPRPRARTLSLVPRSSPDRYVTNIRAIVAEATRLGAGAVVVGPVYRDRTTLPDEARRMTEYRSALARTLATDGTLYLEVPDLMEWAADRNADLFVEHIHPNHRGHRRLAEGLALFLQEHREAWARSSFSSTEQSTLRLALGRSGVYSRESSSSTFP